MGPVKKRAKTEKKLSEVSVEEFMAGGLSSDSEGAPPEPSPGKKAKKAAFTSPKHDAAQIDVPKKNKKIKKKRSKIRSEKDSDEDSEEEEPERTRGKIKARKAVLRTKAQKPEETSGIAEHDFDNEGSENDHDEGSSDDSDVDMEKNKEIIRNLKDTDPDFYQYLEEHDKDLLDFYTNDADQEDDDESGDGQAEEEPAEPTRHKKILKLEQVRQFELALRTKPDFQKIADVISCFRAAVLQAEGESATPQTGKHQCPFRVEGQTIFNAVVKLCLNDLLPALHKVLNLPEPSVPKDGVKPFDPTKCHSWRKVALSVKVYLMQVVKLATAVTEPQLVSVLLRHVLFLVPYYVAFPQVAKTLLKRLVALWCEGEETVRVVAFLCLVRTVRNLPRPYLDTVLKHMYMSYVRNSKFTSPSTWPLINFMKRTLVEAYAIDEGLAYQHAFLYIRQLAIHLRNALTVRKKDTCKAVYNWQYVHCCLLWCHLLSTSAAHGENLRALVYPLVQTVVGTIQLVPAAKFVPLRFHLVRGLVQVSAGTNIFIPILPHLLQVFTIVNFDLKHSSTSMRPVDLSCALRVSPTQMKESGFRDAVIENFYELMVEYLAQMSSSVAFPELVLLAMVQLREFAKKCKVANYNKKVRQLLEKMEENYKFIEERRKNCGVALSDKVGLERLEEKWSEEGTPCARFYEQWSKLRSKKQDTAANRRVLKKLPKPESGSDTGSDSGEEQEVEEKVEKKPKKAAKKQKKVKKAKPEEEEVAVGDEDVVQDMELSSTSEEEEESSQNDDDDLSD
ncbi:conserved hypothetical protein [Ixodes scapularis]|uniref:Uncharacterized protein n=1 Tax=Ixodes scapularis TaxID=6945 RepID=B7Q746_IXOSC|nr:conserved hypothetical protein [Ixodes scapularis]|eukprot:XP_002412097.1 conserved hypothetical protein [Ixodes scapularis]